MKFDSIVSVTAVSEWLGCIIIITV